MSDEVEVTQPETLAPEAPAPETPAPEAPATPPVELTDGMAAAAAEALKTPDAETAVEPVAEQPATEPPATPADPPTEPTAAEEAAALGVKNERAKERFIELRERDAKFREIESRLPEVESKAQQYDEMLGHIASTGATPEQYQSALGYLNIVNNGNPAQLAQMRDALLKEIDWIDGKLGRGGDVLERHQDLRAAVAAGEMTEKYAKEIAETRNLSAAQQQHETQRFEAQRQQQEQNERVFTEAREQLNALGARLQQTDPQYQAKAEKALEGFRARANSVHPSQWATEFLLEYNAVRLAPPAAKPPVTAVPLRPQGGGAMGKVAGSMEEAVMLGLQTLKAG